MVCTYRWCKWPGRRCGARSCVGAPGTPGWLAWEAPAAQTPSACTGSAGWSHGWTRWGAAGPERGSQISYTETIDKQTFKNIIKWTHHFPGKGVLPAWPAGQCFVMMTQAQNLTSGPETDEDILKMVCRWQQSNPVCVQNQQVSTPDPPPDLLLHLGTCWEPAMRF